MRKPTYSAVAATAALVLAAGGVGWAASLPANSVGSPQVKNGSVRSIDLKNGGVRLVDLAPDARIAGPQGPKGDSPFSAIGQARASFSGCGQGGWCYVTNAGSGTLVGQLSAAPDHSGTSFVSSGVLALPAETSVLVRASATVWAFGSGGNKDIICTVRDGNQSVVSSGWIRMIGNTSQVIAVERLATLAAGEHDLSLVCRASGVETHAVTDAAISFIAQG